MAGEHTLYNQLHLLVFIAIFVFNMIQPFEHARIPGVAVVCIQIEHHFDAAKYDVQPCSDYFCLCGVVYKATTRCIPYRIVLEQSHEAHVQYVPARVMNNPRKESSEYAIKVWKKRKMLSLKHWNANDSLKAPEGFELQLYVYASQLVYQGWCPAGNVWETLVRMFLEKFSIGAEEKAVMVNQLRVILLIGVSHMSRYIREGWDTEDNEENMKVLCSILEIKMIVDKNPNV